MIIANYVVAGLLFCLGLFAVISQRHLVKVVLGLSVMESSTYLLLVSLGYRENSTAPVLAGLPGGRSQHDLTTGNVADPVLQNFCITAVVIGVAVTAVFLTVVVRAAQHYRSVDTADLTQLRG